MSVAAALVVEPTPAAATPVPAPVPPPILTGSLRVESEPRGARVLVDGEERGQTPLTVPELPLGARAVRVELRGHEPQTHDVVLDASAPNGELRVALLRRAPGLGEADLTSTPSGAAVAIDSRVVGRTPLSGVKLSPGIRRIQMTLEGYEPWTGTVDVVAGRRAQIDAPLETVARATPAPTPEPVDAARVYRVEEVDGSPRKLSGFSPAYPSGRAARLKSGQSVSVVVSFVVTETGRIDDVQVVESGGPVIDEVVVAAVRGWTYRPATRRGTPVKVRTLFKQTFIGG
jgi:TonB family protein